MKKPDNFSLVNVGPDCHLYEIVSTDKLAMPSVLPFYNNTRMLKPLRINGFEIIPRGEYNRYPDEIREMLDENNLTPEIINKQTQLTWGQGPRLYIEEFLEDGSIKRKYVKDKDILKWLKTWDYEDYLLKNIIEFRHLNGCYSKLYRNLGARIGQQPQIVKLESVPSVNAALEWPFPDMVSGKIRNILIADFAQPWQSGIKSYPVFDPFNPFENPISMSYSNLYTFALTNEYSRSPFHGTFNWIKLSSSIAKLLINYNLNSAAIKWHVKSPQVYWDNVKTQLEQDCENKGIKYTEKIFSDYKDEIFNKISKALSGINNVGKFVTTEEIFDEEANQYVGWKFEPLDQKVKDFIDAQINISKRAGFETSAGMGMHPAITNLTFEGNLPSGSEQLYAFKIYLQTGIPIPEMIICKDLNAAIAANFPGTEIKIGFYHQNVLTEEQTKPKDRVKNN